MGRYDKRKGGLFTKDEVRKLWQRSWKGKQPGDPFIVRGGYNCRHQWSLSILIGMTKRKLNN